MSRDRPLAVITGGTSGIGLETARLLAPGYDLALVYKSNTERAKQSQALLRSDFAHCQIEIFEKDLLTAQSTKEVHREIKSKFPQAASILVNSAGVAKPKLLLQSTDEEVIECLMGNLMPTIWMTRAILPEMYRENFGRIVMVSSIATTCCNRGQVPYATAKGGIETFVRALALEVAHRGVTVNSVRAGLTDTPMVAGRSIAVDEASLKGFPLRRLVQPSEVAAAIALLCSEQAAAIVGAALTIDGGSGLGSVLMRDKNASL